MNDARKTRTPPVFTHDAGLLIDHGPDGVADAPENRARRTALMTSLPDRVHVPEAERLLDAGAAPVFPGFALRWVVGLIVIGCLAYFVQ